MEVELKLPTLHQAQQQIKDEARRFNVLDCGRRFGKDILGHELVIESLLDGQPVAWFSPTYKMMTETWQEITRTLQPIISRANGSERRIELATGGVLELWSLDAQDTARGRKYKRAIVNEAAMVENLMDAFNFVIRPTLADLLGDAWFLSTPRGRNGFWQLYLWGKDKDSNPDWRAWKFPTSANPFIAASEVEAMRQQMPEQAFNQEILAEFLEDSGAVFRGVDKVCKITERADPEKHTGHYIAIGVDWGKQTDFTVLTAKCYECKHIVDWDRFKEIDYHVQRERLQTMVLKWHNAPVLPERNSIGVPNIEELARDDIVILSGDDGAAGFNTTQQSKAQLIEGLALDIEREQLLVPVEYADELKAFELLGRSPNGLPKYGAPEGAHDDRVISLALANRAANMGQSASEIIPNVEYSIGDW